MESSLFLLVATATTCILFVLYRNSRKIKYSKKNIIDKQEIEDLIKQVKNAKLEIKRKEPKNVQ